MMYLYIISEHVIITEILKKINVPTARPYVTTATTTYNICSDAYKQNNKTTAPNASHLYFSLQV